MIKHQRRKKRGSGIIDFLKNIIPIVKDVVEIGKNTREIVNEIRNKKHVEEIVSRINQIKGGSGFSFI